MTTYTPANGSPLDYTPSDVTGHADQVLNLFVPGAPFVQPADGWPVMIETINTSFINTSLVTSIDASTTTDYRLSRALQMGMAVVSASVSTTRSVGDEYAAPNHGRGIFYPPGHSTGMWEDETYPMAEKDVIYILTYLRKNAADVGGTGTKINTLKFSMACESGGALVWLPVIFGRGGSEGQDFALGAASTDTQYGQSTAVQRCILRLFGLDWNFFDGGVVNSHQGGAVLDVLPATLADVPQAVKDAVSPVVHDDAAVLGTGAIKWLFGLHFNTANISHDFTAPYAAVETGPHTPYGQFVWKSRYPDLSVVYNEGQQTIYSDGAYTAERALHDRFFAAVNSAYEAEILWLAREFGTIPFPALGAGHIHSTVAPGLVGPTTIASVTTTDAEWNLLFAENPYRRLGVWVENATDSASNGIAARVGTGTVAAPSDAGPLLFPTKATGIGPKFTFIPGTAGIITKRNGAGNVTVAAMEY